MKGILIFLLSLLIASSALPAAAQVAFHDVSIEEARRVAAEEGKQVLVYVTADWCAPCKVIEAEMLPDPEVGDRLNARFVAVKLDYEEPAQKAAFLELNVGSGIPAFVVVDPDGEVIGSVIGARYGSTDGAPPGLDKNAMLESILKHARW
jgi:thiol:disulfide interchange protein